MNVFKPPFIKCHSIETCNYGHFKLSEIDVTISKIPGTNYFWIVWGICSAELDAHDVDFKLFMSLSI